MDHRLVTFLHQRDGLLRAARQNRRAEEDHGAVAVADAPFRAPDVSVAGRFLKR